MNRKKFYNVVAIGCGVWFLITGSIWIYFFNLVFAYPVAIVGVVFWHKGKTSNPSALNRAALVVLTLGLIASVATLLLLR